MNHQDPDLVHWRSMRGRKQALEFTPHGWALAEACTQLGDYEMPHALIVSMLGKIIARLVEDDASYRSHIDVEWHIAGDGLSAAVAFQADALRGLSGVCGMAPGELQSAIQATVEMLLLEMYETYKASQPLH
jgi:hypothetical protein